MVAWAFTRFATVGSCKPLGSLFIFSGLGEVCYLKALPALHAHTLTWRSTSLVGDEGENSRISKDWSCGSL